MIRTSLRGIRAARQSRTYAAIKFNENFDNPKLSPKPKLSQFKYPLFHTFLIASTAYMALNTLWYGLEYNEVEKKLREKSAKLEEEMNVALEEAKVELVDQKPKRSWIFFWRKS